jgi:CubicO group peptidase (beta-lactamase class C family)
MTVSISGSRAFVCVTGRPEPFEIFAVEKARFNIPGMGIEVIFVLENGTVTGLNFIRGGASQFARKENGTQPKTANNGEIMKKSHQTRMIWFLLGGVLLGTASLSSQVISPEQRIQRIEAGVNGEPLSERMKLYKVPGVSIALINNQQIEWTRAWGVLSNASSVPATPESIFQAASITKALVAAVAMTLVDQGRLDLDKDVNAYLKSWKIPDSALSQGKKVTMRLLLSHQSGLPMGNLTYDQSGRPSLLQVLNGEAPAQNKPFALQTVPGAEWNYSNMGYVVIQQVLEDVTGKPLAQLMQELLFVPMDMSSSTLAYPLAPDLQKKEALPHLANGEVGAPYMHPAALAQGGLMTTPSDLARFTLELMAAAQGRESRLLPARTVRQMLSKQSDTKPELFDGMVLSQGLGLFLRGEGQDMFFTHSGGNYPGSLSVMWGLPGRGSGVVIMVNGANGYPLMLEILAAIEKEYGWPSYVGVKAAPPPPEAVSENLLPYLGRYAFGPETAITISAMGSQLFAQVTGRPTPFEIVTVEKDKFNVPGFGIEVNFVRENGTVTGLNFVRGGASQFARKEN